MTLEQLASWLDAYGRGWESQDVDRLPLAGAGWRLVASATPAARDRGAASARLGCYLVDLRA